MTYGRETRDTKKAVRERVKNSIKRTYLGNICTCPGWILHMQFEFGLQLLLIEITECPALKESFKEISRGQKWYLFRIARAE
jgi:hypothetical protein